VLDSPRVYVGILLVLLLGVLLDLGMRLLEHAATRHRAGALPRRAAPAI
jgi:ABC-type nitrate/sulfonate/bicarbonate transport system permease component